MSLELDLLAFDPETITTAAEVVESPDGIACAIDPTATVAFDIETGPLPEDQIWAVTDPFPELQPFDESSVRIGNLKDPAKIAAKIAAARESHVADWQAKKAKHERETIEKAALNPMTGLVLAIGYGDATGKRLIHAAPCEADLLTELWDVYLAIARSGGRLVGWNSHGFDLPFCRQRSFYHGVAVPESLVSRSRFFAECSIDLMESWCAGRGHARLGDVARFLGIGAKNGEGKDFAVLWEADRDAACEYLANDISMTVGVAARMGF